MTQPRHDPKANAFAKFEQMGLDQVRLQYGGQPDQGAAVSTKMFYGWAKEWLAPFEREARLSNEASQAESLATAISVKDAAWEAASAARDAADRAQTANTIATLALIAAVIAIAFSVIGLFLR